MFSSSCLSVIYNPDPLSRECRLSRFNQRDSRLVFDAQFDYFENVEGMNGFVHLKHVLQ